MSMKGRGSGEYDAAKGIYHNSRLVVDMMVNIGKISKNATEKEWAKRVADGLLEIGLKVPSTVMNLIKRK
jgi:hypothetical protein